MAGSGAYRVLVLYVTPGRRFERLTTLHHLDALTGLDGPVEVLSFNAVRGAPGWLRRLRFDAVVLHTTLLCQRWTPTFETWKRGIEWLADLPAVKIAFPQDEYDFAHVLDEWLDELGVSVVCTVLDDRHRSELYPRLSGRASFYEVLTGYIDEDSAQDLRRRIVPSSERTPDLVYRATKLPYWYGSHGQSKHLIGRAAVARASRHGLSYDISTRPGDMILGDAWLDFLAAGRATIGTESGSSVLDPRGEIQARVRGLLAENPGLSFDQLSHQMPAGWDDYRFFAISPRHLEAIATKTAQILVRGRYSGVLEADRHYIPVEPDFSNLDDALEQLRDPGLAEQIAEQAYEDVYQSGLRSSRQLTETLNGIIHEHAPTASAGQGIAFTIGAPIARAHGRVEHALRDSVSNVLRTGRGIAALLRLVLSDRHARRLLGLYLGSSPARERVGPRAAIVDLLCVSQLRKAATSHYGVGFQFEVDIDHKAHHLTFRSVTTRTRPSDPSITEDAIAALLAEHPWDFTWDHTAVAAEAHAPILGRLTTPLYLQWGVRDLATLSWLARNHPYDIANALAPVLGR